MLRTVGHGPKLLREFNELNILRFIKDSGPLSRADLAKKYRVSKATVSDIISRLLKMKIVCEIGQGQSSRHGGRRPIMIEFSPLAGFIIGIEIKRDHARVLLLDLNASIQNKKSFEFSEGTALANILQQIYKIIDAYLDETWVRQARPIGIGIAVPGLIDYNHGYILESDSLKSWEAIPLKSAFEERYGIETFVENDVNAMTFGEICFGRGRGHQNALFLWIGDGIGAGIIIKGELYRGVTNSAGEVGYYELGHLIRNSSHFKWLYNGHKTFGSILSEKVLIDAAKAGIKGDVKTQIRLDALNVQSILDWADSGDEFARVLLQEYADIVGILCINLINTINPEVLMIGGDLLAYNPLVLNTIRERVKKDALHTPILAVQIQNAALKELAGAMGAAALALDDLFYNDQLNVARYGALFGNGKV